MVDAAPPGPAPRRLLSVSTAEESERYTYVMPWSSNRPPTESKVPATSGQACLRGRLQFGGRSDHV